MANGDTAVLALLQDVKQETISTRREVGAMNRELGGVQATLLTMKEGNEKRDSDVRAIRDSQANCPARSAQTGVNARLKRLERADEDITGSVDIVAQRQQALESARDTKNNGVRVWDAVKKVWPVIILGVVGGAALGGWILAMAFMGS